MNTLEEIIEVEFLELKNNPKNLFEFSSYNKSELIELHHGYGQLIRNKYKFWTDSVLTEAWRLDVSSREFDGGIDCSPDHPDQLSMTIIEHIWEKANTKSENNFVQ